MQLQWYALGGPVPTRDWLSLLFAGGAAAAVSALLLCTALCVLLQTNLTKVARDKFTPRQCQAFRRSAWNWAVQHQAAWAAGAAEAGSDAAAQQAVPPPRPHDGTGVEALWARLERPWRVAMALFALSTPAFLGVLTTGAWLKFHQNTAAAAAVTAVCGASCCLWGAILWTWGRPAMLEPPQLLQPARARHAPRGAATACGLPWDWHLLPTPSHEPPRRPHSEDEQEPEEPSSGERSAQHAFGKLASRLVR